MDFLSQIFKSALIKQVDSAQVHGLDGQSPKPYLLDVRTVGEFMHGHVNGAVNISLDEIATRMGRIPKAREIICICETGSRSRVAVRQLERQGYKVSNMRTGMLGWKRAGLPVKKG
jgi:rhodanese-related sulfurtransferase